LKLQHFKCGCCNNRISGFARWALAQFLVILNQEFLDGSLRKAVSDHNIPVLLYEAGEALRFDEVAIRAGLKGIINVMRNLGMLAQKKVRNPPPEPLIARSSRWIRTPQSGILRSLVPLGHQVEPGDIIGRVADPFGKNEQVILATDAGIIIGRTNLPLVHEGEALFHVAHFKEPDTAAESVGAFQDQHDPFTDEELDDEPIIV
jgi:predicted deacylase